MNRTQMAFFWGLFILIAALLFVALEMPTPSTAILVTTLSAAAAASLNRRRASCGKEG